MDIPPEDLARLIVALPDEKYSIGPFSVDKWNGTITVYKYSFHHWWERIGSAPTNDIDAIAKLLEK